LGFAPCTATNRSAPDLRVLTCATCPGLTTAVNASGATVRTPCAGHGTCSQYSGACYCDAGWGGLDCNTTAAPAAGNPCDGVGCSGVGICSAGACTCLPGYTGPACQYRTPSPATYFWATSPWSSCSRDCGSGAMQRTATCMAAVNDELQNNFTVAAAPVATACSAFTRPPLAADGRTLTCGGTVASLYLLFAANTSLLFLSDTVDAALSAAVVREIATYLRATTFPAAALPFLEARLTAVGLAAATTVDATADANATLLQLEWISSSTRAPDGLDLPAADFLAALRTGLAAPNTTLRATTTYLRAVLPMSASLAASLASINGSALQDGLLVYNVSSSAGALLLVLLVSVARTGTPPTPHPAPPSPLNSAGAGDARLFQGPVGGADHWRRVRRGGGHRGGGQPGVPGVAVVVALRVHGGRVDGA